MIFFKNMSFLFKYSWNISKRRFLAAFIQILLDSTEPFAYLIIPRYIIDELTIGKDWDRVISLIVIFIAVIGGYRLLRLMLQVFINMSINRCDVKTGMFYAFHFLQMNYEKMEDSGIRDMQGKVSANVRPNALLDALTAFLTSIIKLAGFSYIIATLDPVILIIVFVIITVNYFLSRKTEKSTYLFQPITARFTRVCKYIFSTMIGFDYAKEVRINKASSVLSNRFDGELKRFNAENKKYLFKQSLIKLFGAVVDLIQMVVMYGYVAYMAVIGRITVGAFSMYIGSIYNLSGSLNSIVSNINTFAYLSKHVADYKDYIKIAIPSTENEINNLPENTSNNVMFEFKDVSFTYPNTDKTVLKNISVKIHQGEKLSIVGLNGAGKTTFIKLLCRLYTPTNGQILYRGVDISTIKTEEYVKLLSVVFQDFKLFSFSFTDNIVLNQSVDMKKLNESIDKSGLRNKVNSLSDGINTNIYKDFDENGIEFSGGEGQKLVIARAYYKNAPIVILDEPTAALDPLAENEIYENFNEIIGNNSAIFISHRLASTRFCDNIAVFESGRIVEYGAHEELMRNQKLYFEMFNKQAQHYKEENEEAAYV